MKQIKWVGCFLGVTALMMGAYFLINSKSVKSTLTKALKETESSLKKKN